MHCNLFHQVQSVASLYAVYSMCSRYPCSTALVRETAGDNPLPPHVIWSETLKVSWKFRTSLSGTLRWDGWALALFGSITSALCCELRRDKSLLLLLWYSLALGRMSPGFCFTVGCHMDDKKERLHLVAQSHTLTYRTHFQHWFKLCIILRYVKYSIDFYRKLKDILDFFSSNNYCLQYSCLNPIIY